MKGYVFNFAIVAYDKENNPALCCVVPNRKKAIWYRNILSTAYPYKNIQIERFKAEKKVTFVKNTYKGVIDHEEMVNLLPKKR